MKKLLIILRNIVIGIIGIILVAVIGFVLYLKLSAAPYYIASSKGFKIPDLNNGYIPQGLYIDDDYTYITGYMNDHSNAPIYVLDDDFKVIKRIVMTNPDGSDFETHAGGLAVYDGNVYVAGGADNCLYVFDKNEIFNSPDNAGVGYKDIIPLNTDTDAIGIAWVEVHDDVLYAGEFYREQNYPTLESHHMDVNGGTNHSLAIALDLKNNLEPIAVYSIPDFVQGMCLDDNNMYISTSYGIPRSHIYTYSRELIKAAGTKEVLDKELPLYILDNDSLIKTRTIAPMSEEIDIKDGKMYVMCESASNKYIFGKLTGHFKCYSSKISYFGN